MGLLALTVVRNRELIAAGSWVPENAVRSQAQRGQDSMQSGDSGNTCPPSTTRVCPVM